MSEHQHEHEIVSKGRLFDVVQIANEDLEKANSLPSDACPRRYCWWWRSLSFEWNASVKEGCTVMESKDLPPKYRRVPCCRSDPLSDVDHFEPRLPHILDDRIDATKWLQCRFERDRESLLNFKRILEGPESDSLKSLAVTLLALPSTATTDWEEVFAKWIEDKLLES